MGKEKPDKKAKKEKSGAGISKKDPKREKKEKKEKLAKALTDPVTGDVSDKLLKEIEKQQADVTGSGVDTEKEVRKGGKKEKKEKKEKEKEKEKGKEKDAERMDVDRADIVVPVVKKDSKEEKGTAVVAVGGGDHPEESRKAKDKVEVVEGGEILVPFAKPLANEKVTKKALKTIKKGAKSKCLKRGVKEVVKSIRKSPPSTLSTPHGIVVLAADISPMDVISHIPVLCEDHNIPYVFVHSRAELGLAGGTKRPTSVVMIVPTLLRGKKSTKEGKEKEKEKEKESKKEDEEGLKEAYDELVKAVKALQ